MAPFKEKQKESMIIYFENDKFALSRGFLSLE